MSRFRYTVYHIICLQARGKQKIPSWKVKYEKRCVAPRRTRWKYLWAVSTARAKSATLKSQPKTAKSFAWECALSTDNRKPKIKPTPKARICLYLLLFYACVLTQGKHPGVSWLQIIGRSAHPTDFVVTIVTRAPIGDAERRFAVLFFLRTKTRQPAPVFRPSRCFCKSIEVAKKSRFVKAKRNALLSKYTRFRIAVCKRIEQNPIFSQNTSKHLSNVAN